MALTKRETIYVGGRPVDVHFFEGLSKETAPLVVAMMEGVLPRYAGLGGTNYTNLNADATNFLRSDVWGRIYAHWQAEFRLQKLMKIIAVDNKDQTSVLREQGDEHRHE
jgi:hypothetical protein